MIDTGVSLYIGGACYYRQIDSLAMSLCVANVITNEHWDEYVMAGYQLARKTGLSPKVSMAAFTHGFPSATQRGKLASHLKKFGVPPLLRVAVLTDSALIRGAMTAFGWIMPSTTLRAFEVLDISGCLEWLKQAAPFDEVKAASAWDEGRRLLGLDRGRAKRTE